MGCLRAVVFYAFGLALLMEGLSVATGSPMVVVSCPGELPWLRTFQNLGVCATAGHRPTANPAGDFLAKLGPNSTFAKQTVAQVSSFVDQYFVKVIAAVERQLKPALSN